jgi:hypothetical protein
MDPYGDFDRKMMNPYANLGLSREEYEQRCLELAKKIHPDLFQADERSRRRYLELVKTWHPQTFWDELDRLGAEAQFKKEWQDKDFTISSSTPPPTADNICDCAPSSGMIIASGIIGLGVSYFAAKHIGI